ncbi:MAG TPA: Ig-like domain-containing protein, partial [Acidobacteriaceae bacterium]|nr:Ig-like domain-containing protein [Acidobacteriaceae bacterium]
MSSCNCRRYEYAYPSFLCSCLLLLLAAAGCGGASSPSSSNPTKVLTAITASPATASLAAGASQQFTAKATYNDGSTADVTSAATWTDANAKVATITSSGVAIAVAAGSTTIKASLPSGASSTASITVTPSAGANITTWHVDNNRSGLNPNETSLTPTNVAPQTFGKLFSYLVDGYAYAEPLLMSNVTINGVVHDVLYVATENDSVYAFDADYYGTGAPLWKTSLLNSGEAPSSGPIQPYEGVTSTPVIDPVTNTIYVVSVQKAASGAAGFRLNALDITTGARKFGSPVVVQASVKGTNSDAVNGTISLPTSCIQRAALLLANGTIYMGFSSCHSGWLLSYDAHTLSQTGVFNASPNIDGEGTYGGAGGVWMGSGGPVADSAGNIYISTGNGP